jgi:hypothetical protein
MLQLDVQSHSELLDIEARCLPVDADPLSNVASLIGRERAWTHGNKCDGSRTDALMQVAEHPVKAGGCGRGVTYRANGKAGPAQPGRCAPANRLSENLTPRRSVSSGSSVWLSDGGGLTLFSPVDLVGSDRLLPCRPPPPRIAGVT